MPVYVRQWCSTATRQEQTRRDLKREGRRRENRDRKMISTLWELIVIYASVPFFSQIKLITTTPSSPAFPRALSCSSFLLFHPLLSSSSTHLPLFFFVANWVIWGTCYHKHVNEREKYRSRRTQYIGSEAFILSTIITIIITTKALRVQTSAKQVISTLIVIYMENEYCSPVT